MLFDTYYLIRLITQDLPDLAAQAAETVGKFATHTILLPDAVLAEIAVVLKLNPHYQYPREVICDALESLISTRRFALTLAGQQAITHFKTTNLDFVDCLVIAEQKTAVPLKRMRH